jgi:endonuclease/exonuclease/phosphatase family metal-dependent hydrolase
VRIATFNILHGQTVTGAAEHTVAHFQSDVEGPHNAEPLCHAAVELDADVLGLQEVDVDQARSGLVHQPSAVATAIGAVDWRFVPTVIGTPGGLQGFRSSTRAERRADDRPPNQLTDSGQARYGIALLSRLPVVSWHQSVFEPAPMSLPLLVQTNGRPKMLRVRDEQRAALAAVIDGPFGQFTVATAHLSFVPGYNVRQLRKLRKWLAAFPRPLILIGDFNLPSPVPARTLKWTPLFRGPTFPSYKPRIQFDHVLVDGLSPRNLATAKVRAVSMPVSDHCALAADIELP